jgi:regulator of RNase E activity RraA
MLEPIKVQRPSKKLIEKLNKTSTATAWGVLNGMGITSIFLKGLRPITPGSKMIGPAQTIKYLPGREDRKQSPEEFRKSAAHQVAEKTQPGDVIVLNGILDGYGGMGDCMVTAFVVKEAAGMVFDGRIRDYPYLKTLEMPIFSRGAQPGTTPYIFPVAANVMIECAGILIVPGDIMFGDDDGVIVIPREKAEEVAEEAVKKESIEVYSRKLLEMGRPLSEAYPPKNEWLTRPPI